MTAKYRIEICLFGTWHHFKIDDSNLLDTRTTAEFLARECARYRPGDEFRVKAIKKHKR